LKIDELGRALDRGIGLVAPQWGAKRAHARGLMEARERAADIVRRYEGGSFGRQTANWVATSGSADTELRSGLTRLRNRSRDLTANNCWAGSAVNALQTDLVGTGILWKPRMLDGSKNQSLLDKAKRLFLPWFESTKCDLRGKQNGYAIQSTGAREIIEAGEIVIRRVWTGERPVPFRLQAIEADHIDTSRDGQTTAEGGRIIQGVEYNRVGRVVALWLFRDHPGDMWSSNWISERVVAEDLLHPFEVLRYGQSRGIPRPTSAIIRCRSLDEYENAEEMRKKVAACFVGFVHDLTATEGPIAGGLGEPQDPGDPANGTAPVRKFTPGTFQGLPAGKTIAFGKPESDNGYVDFVTTSLRGIAKSYEVTYERISGDLRNTNFSSARVGSIGSNASLDRTTWHTLVPQMCEGIWAWFIEAMVVTGDLPPDTIGATWTPPKRPMVDPTQEIPAALRAIRAGLKTRSETNREMGDDPEEKEVEFAEENARADKLKLSFDSDGRRPEQQPVVVSADAAKPAKK